LRVGLSHPSSSLHRRDPLPSRAITEVIVSWSVPSRRCSRSCSTSGS
jgi:hypothetical protein